MNASRQNRTFVVTGGHGGLGFQCARTLAREFKVELLLAGRDVLQAEAVADAIRHEVGGKVSVVQLDLGSFASVRLAAAEIGNRIGAGEISPLHGIVCNAGLMTAKRLRYSQDGVEQTFAVNHLGHFLLVNLLLPILAGPGRIVVVSSDTHDPKTLGGRINKPGFPDAYKLAYPERDSARAPGKEQRYSTSKLCNVLFAYELDRRLKQERRDIAVLAFNPGFTPGTGFTRNFPWMARQLLGSGLFTWLIRRLGGVIGDLKFSGEAMGRVAGDLSYQTKSGAYFECNDFNLYERQSSTLSYDEGLAKKLWADSARLVGIGDR